MKLHIPKKEKTDWMSKDEGELNDEITQRLA